MDVALAGSAEFVSAGGYSSCAIRELLYGNHALLCWGNNFNYQLGYGTKEYVGREDGEMPPFETPVGASALSVGISSYNARALTSSGVVRCWGRADYSGYGVVGFVAAAKRSGPPAGDLVHLKTWATCPSSEVSRALGLRKTMCSLTPTQALLSRWRLRRALSAFQLG